MLRARSSSGLSIAFVAVGLGNGLIWGAYSFVLGNLAMIVVNVVGCSIGAALISVTIYLRRRGLCVSIAPNERDFEQELASLSLQIAAVRVEQAGHQGEGSPPALVLAPAAA